MTKEEVEQEVAVVFEQIIAACDGHSFAVNKTALQLARDFMIRTEATTPQPE